MTDKVETISTAITTDIKEYIDERDTEMVERVETRVKSWVVRAVLGHLVTFLPMLFFLGGIYYQNNAALKLLERHQIELAERSRWMAERERWETAVELQWQDRDKPLTIPRIK